MPTNTKEYDYIIIGGGSAGCTVAARLSENPSISVLLLEAGLSGGGILDSWKIEMPAAFNHIWQNEKYAWLYYGEPEPMLNNRRVFQPRGKVLGGSSSINGMAFIRGHALDFERWVKEGAEGWSWQDVLPYFKKSETWEGGESEYRGGSGPVHVRQGTLENPLYDVFLEAGQQAGYSLTTDVNGEHQEGFGAFQMNVHEGVRASTEEAYIRPNRDRQNLTVVDQAHVHEIVIKGSRATGVRFLRGGENYEISATREVILSGGAINSPQLLMLSGIGPAQELAAVGIPCKVDLPGVGQNLQDHPLVYMKFGIDKPISMSQYMRPDKMLMTGARWLATHGGPGATNNVEAVALLRTESTVTQPDVLLQYIPVIADHDRSVKHSVHGFTYCIGPTHMEASGWVKLSSKNPADAPRIFSNFLSTDYDMDIMRKSLELGRHLVAQKAHNGLGVKFIEPGNEVRTRAEIDEYLRNYTSGDFHLIGTCKMGTDEMSVVDPQLRVHGVDGLRVVDASVMPSIVGANTNCTTIMIAERAADIIKAKGLLAPAKVRLPK